MRITTTATLRRYILSLTLLMLSIGYAAAQDKTALGRTVTFSGTHITLGKAMSEIEAQTSFVFIFNSDYLNTGTAVKFTQSRLTVSQALDQMFGDGIFRYVIRNRFIGIDPTGAMAQRANLVARARDNAPLTGDRYSRTNPDNHTTESLHRDSVRYDEGAYVTERVETIIPAQKIERSYPDSYSAYKSASQHIGRLQKSLPHFAIKTNLLYGGALLTPNLAVEIGTAPRQTLELNGSYQWWGRKNDASDNHKQFTHWIVRPEYRWWTCERFNGHYFGAHALYSRYFVSGREIPLLFEKEYSYDGQAVGAGVTYGYHWAVSKTIGLEFNVGVGYVYMWGDRGTCRNCDWQMRSWKKHYLGPTRAGINLVFMIR